ncbi:MAG: LURP-one-related family protein [Clostridia bacterium]|nr:LURP-one-related family protein [Clostridia bacterium]
MKKLIIKNKMVTMRGSSFVLDEEGNKVFRVKGKFFTMTQKKRIYDMDGELKYIVRNKFWHFLNSSCFILDDEKEKIAMLTNGLFDFKRRFVLKGYSDEIEISGAVFQFPNLEMQIVKNGKVIGKIIRNLKDNFFRDCYVAEIEDETEEAFVVALVIAIDNIYDERRKN